MELLVILRLTGFTSLFRVRGSRVNKDHRFIGKLKSNERGKEKEVEGGIWRKEEASVLGGDNSGCVETGTNEGKMRELCGCTSTVS